MQHNTSRRALLSATALACLGLLAGTAHAQSAWPAKIVKIVVPYAPGGAVDVVTRKMAQKLTEQTGQSFIVENKPGASSMLAAQSVMRAAPDGYTVLITGNVAFTGNPHVVKKMLYDPVADFTPVTTLSKGPMYLYVNPKT